MKPLRKTPHVRVLLTVSLMVVALLGGSLRVEATSLSAAQLFAKLQAAPEQAGATYDRNLFNHWTDADNDCQDARAEVLARDSKSPVAKS